MSGGDGAPRRVLVAINDLAAGGAQRAALDQAAGLDPARFKVEVASFEIEPARSGIGERHRHVPLHRAPAGGASLGRGLRAFDRLLRRFDPELVHGHLAAAVVAATVGARLRGVPCTAATLHNLTDWEEKRRHPLRLVLRRALRGCDAVIVVSDAVRAAMARVDPVLARRAERIHNGVDLAPFAAVAGGRAAARVALGLGSDDFVVGAVARFDPRKGLDLLIEAVAIARARVPSLRLLLVGDGPERPRLEARVAALELASRVRFAGEQADVRPFLAALDLFAAPSRTEGQGVAMIEALAAGLPVVGSRVGGIPEVVTDPGCGVLVEPESAAALAATIAHLANAPPVLAAMAAEASRRASRFSLGESCARLAAVYHRLLATVPAKVAA